MNVTKRFALTIVMGSFALGALLALQLRSQPSSRAVVAASLPTADISPAVREGRDLQYIGPVAVVREDETGLAFRARVDTGARRCSLHVAEWDIPDGSPDMEENIGKTIRFRVENRRGESEWLERKIVNSVVIRTSEQEEMRYLVPLMLKHEGVEREVLVSLNDRSRMNYSMLLGRNYLAGEFIIDVTRDDSSDDHLVSNP